MESTETADGRHPYLRCKNTAVKCGPKACGKWRAVTLRRPRSGPRRVSESFEARCAPTSGRRNPVLRLHSRRLPDPANRVLAAAMPQRLRTLGRLDRPVTFHAERLPFASH